MHARARLTFQMTGVWHVWRVCHRLDWMDTHDQKLYREQPWDSLTNAILIEDAHKRGGNVAVHCTQFLVSP